ncbi:MAG: penicillin-binding protein [Nitrosomonas sp.]|nr:MAG: penicillin-binding protein [Nitrosomonas sp.]
MTHYSASNITMSAWRSRILLAMLLIGLLGLVGRAAYLQGMKNDFLRQEGESRYSRIVETSVNRGMITDRHGEVLAISTPVASVCANPREMDASNEQLENLAALLEMDVTEIQKRIADKRRGFVYLKRRVLPESADDIANMNLPGVFLKNEYQRFYPAKEMAAHVLGLTDIDDQGQEGVEREWQEKLASGLGKRRVIRDRKGRIVEDVEKIQALRQGQDLILSLDSGIQHLAHSGLKHAVEAHKAEAGSIVVLDAQTGEVLALSNLPVYNPNRRATINDANRRNRALVDTFEPGSTLKPFAIAVAMEVGQVSPDTIVQTAPGTFKVGRATIRDVKDKGKLSVAQVIQESSNIGTAKIALSLPAQTLWEIFSRSGFGVPAGIGFPGEAKGELRPYSTWRPIEQATMSYGHGISVSLLQLARAYTLFTTGGELKPVSLLKKNVPVMGQQVISRSTALAMSNMLELVTQPGGTAPLAQVNGYRVAGKTGTAHKLINGRYAEDRYISSFVGYAPVSSPRLIIAVMLDEPSAGQYFGGAVAAPVFNKVMTGALRMLNVPHDAPANNIVRFPATLEVEVGG